MKKLFFLLPLFLLLSVAVVNAQSCCAHKAVGASCANKSASASPETKMSTAAAADPTIEKRQADDGTVSYVRKEADQQGNVRFVNLQYDEASNTFVAAPAKTMTAEDKTGAVKKGAACCAGGTGAKKACCAEGGNKKACAGEKANQ